MACEYVQPNTFVKVGEKVEVVFLNSDDVPSWYKGIIVRVDHHGKDSHGNYVECDVDYEDGESVTDTRFYDCDFNDENSLDAWRFSNSLTQVIEALDDTRRDVEVLKENSRSGSCDEEDESDESGLNYDTGSDERYIGISPSPISHLICTLGLMILTGFVVKNLYLKYVDKCHEMTSNYTVCDITHVIDTFHRSCFNIIDKLKGDGAKN